MSPGLTSVTPGSTSPTSRPFFLLRPTSITTAPGLTISLVTRPGTPAAETRTSAPDTALASWWGGVWR